MIGWRIRKLARALKKPSLIWNYIGTRLCARYRPDSVPFLPVHLDIEPNNTCNFSCSHCQVTYWDKERVYLDPAGLRRILDQFEGFLRVKLQGMGEPLLNKDLAELLREGEAYGAEMSIISNGSIYTEEIAEELMRLRTTLITFSLDGATSSIFEKIRSGSNFEKVKENIDRFVRARGSASSPILAAWTVVTRDNVEELPGIVALADSLGLDCLTIQTFLSDWGKSEMQRHTDPVKVELESERLLKALDRATIAARSARLDLKIVSHDYYSSDHPCPWPWTSAFIAANGDVVPCCIIADSDIAFMGNLFEEDFRTIWNGEAYRALRDRIRTNDIPEYCRGCYKLP